jgi:hypothetical protein
LYCFIQELDLSFNSLAVLPDAISSLTSLTALRLNHNQLSYLPQELTALSGLVLLDARWAAVPADSMIASLHQGWSCTVPVVQQHLTTHL